MASHPSTVLTATDLMTPNPRTCSPFSTVLEAVLIFRDADCGAVPVVDAGKAVGILTDRDVALAVAEHGANLPALPVGDIMTKGIVSVAPDDTLETIIEKFGEERIRRLLVMDRNEMLMGIVSWADVAPYVSECSIGHAVSEVVDKTEEGR